jgi:hypothetical protein
MAVPELQAFHQQTRDLLNGIALGGMKIDLQRGHRYTHPSFKGLPYNSTGSRNQMAFLSKAENDVPLEAKVMAGGARTQQAQRFYQKKLKGVAEWTRNQQLMKDGLPPTPPNPAQFELSQKESITLELDTLLTTLNNVIESGDLSSMTTKDFSNIPRLLIKFVASTTEKREIVNVIRAFETDLIEPLKEISNPSLRGNERANMVLREKGSDLLSGFIEPSLDFLKGYIRFLETYDGSPKSQEVAIRSLVKENFGNQRTWATAIKEAFLPPQKDIPGQGIEGLEALRGRLTRDQVRKLAVLRGEWESRRIPVEERERLLEERAIQMMEENMAQGVPMANLRDR